MNEMQSFIPIVSERGYARGDGQMVWLILTHGEHTCLEPVDHKTVWAKDKNKWLCDKLSALGLTEGVKLTAIVSSQHPGAVGGVGVTLRNDVLEDKNPDECQALVLTLRDLFMETAVAVH